jgi:quinol-cytochrome oxidoreductase complex cytochrome b subunit
MNSHHHTAQAANDEYPWLHDGSVPHSREDRVAEALALIALVFALCVGVVIALLPVSAAAASSGASSLELRASKTVTGAGR